jgi:hypothetical protein
MHESFIVLLYFCFYFVVISGRLHPSESPIKGVSVRLAKHARQLYQNIVERLCLPRGICQLVVDHVCLVDLEILSKVRISNKGQSESVIANLADDAMLSNQPSPCLAR